MNDSDVKYANLYGKNAPISIQDSRGKCQSQKFEDD